MSEFYSEKRENCNLEDGKACEVCQWAREICKKFGLCLAERKKGLEK